MAPFPGLPATPNPATDLATMNPLTIDLNLVGIGTDFQVVGFEGEESLFGDYLFSVYIQSPNHSLPLKPFVNAPATLVLQADTMPKRYFSGVVLSATFLGTNPRHAFYCFKIVPNFSLLRMTRCSRIFHSKTAIDMIETVLDAHRISNRKFLTVGTYHQYEFFTQSSVSSYDFIRQLMAEEGIFYYYQHSEAGSLMMIQDSTMPFSSSNVTLRHGYSASDRRRPDEVDSCSLEHRVVPSRLVTIPLHTHDLLRLPATSTSGADYDLPYEWTKGSASSVEHLEAMNDQRQASFESSAVVLRGRSYCPNLVPGYTVQLTGSARDEVKGSFVLKRVRHRIGKDGYHNEFVAFPAASRYVPLLPSDQQDFDDNQITPLGEMLTYLRHLQDA